MWQFHLMRVDLVINWSHESWSCGNWSHENWSCERNPFSLTTLKKSNRNNSQQSFLNETSACREWTLKKLTRIELQYFHTIPTSWAISPQSQVPSTASVLVALSSTMQFLLCQASLYSKFSSGMGACTVTVEPLLHATTHPPDSDYQHPWALVRYSLVMTKFS